MGTFSPPKRGHIFFSGGKLGFHLKIVSVEMGGKKKTFHVEICTKSGCDIKKIVSSHQEILIEYSLGY